MLIPPLITKDHQNNTDEPNIALETSTINNNNTNKKVALVFGREESGLTDEEVSTCPFACSIPTGTMQPSLNLSHSVAVIGSWLFEKVSERRSSNNNNNSSNDEDRYMYKTRKEREVLEPATLEEVEALMAKIVGLMVNAGIDARESAGGDNSGRRRMMAGHIRSVLLRSRMTGVEAKSLHGLVKLINAL